jgi:uncharacterized protein (UPF0276 family)
MKFAVNYSKPALALWRERPGAFDLFKLPCWPETVNEVIADYPGYIHFPLKVTGGDGTVRDTETKSSVDFARIEAFMKQTSTPLVNIHLAPGIKYHPDIAPGDFSDAAAEKITARLIRDVETLVRHFGAENVIAENDAGDVDLVNAAILPRVVNAIIRETNCGFLFDISHARLAARRLGMDAKEYIAQLPTDRLKEMHITGIQYLDESWQARLQNSGLLKPEKLSRYRERWMDHLPIVDADWEFLAWAFGQIHSGAWREPWVASCEYGGIGGFFEATMDESVIREQFPQLGKMLRGN